MAKAASDRTDEFIKALGQPPVEAADIAVDRPHVVADPVPHSEAAERRRKVTPSRAGLKHFGGYLDDETLEKIALLRIRLK